MKQKQQAGFTLIETLIAMAIFTIGILGLFGMQTAAIKGNLAANNITTGSTWAAEQVEQLISLKYTDLPAHPAGRCAELVSVDPTDPNNTIAADGTDDSGPELPIYKIYWYVAQDCTLTEVPLAGVVKDEVQRPKHLRVIVTTDKGNGEKLLADFNYIKQNVTNSK